MVKCKYEGTGIWNGRCTGTKEVDHCPRYDKCKQYKPNYTTNADRIRGMNDNELATFINRIVICHHLRNECHCEKCPIHPAKPCDTEGIAEWLIQPAE